MACWSAGVLGSQNYIRTWHTLGENAISTENQNNIAVLLMHFCLTKYNMFIEVTIEV
jgi:hypothetical protein